MNNYTFRSPKKAEAFVAAIKARGLNVGPIVTHNQSDLVRNVCFIPVNVSEVTKLYNEHK